MAARKEDDEKSVVEQKDGNRNALTLLVLLTWRLTYFLGKELASTSITTPPLPACFNPIGQLQVVFSLSPSVLDQYPISGASHLADILKAGEIIWSLCGNYVVKCGSEFAVKIKDQDTTEYSSMMFLEQCGKSIPTPKPLVWSLSIDIHISLSHT